MKKLVKKLWEKKDSKKGFTLVELIVVLVILALLAAIMIPSMIGWINKASDKKVLLDARASLMAAQEYVSEAYATTGTVGESKIAAEAKALSKVTGTISDVALSSTNEITKLVYTADGYVATYTYTPAAADGTGEVAGAWDVKKATTGGN